MATNDPARISHRALGTLLATAAVLSAVMGVLSLASIGFMFGTLAAVLAVLAFTRPRGGVTIRAAAVIAGLLGVLTAIGIALVLLFGTTTMSSRSPAAPLPSASPWISP